MLTLNSVSSIDGIGALDLGFGQPLFVVVRMLHVHDFIGDAVRSQSLGVEAASQKLVVLSSAIGVDLRSSRDGASLYTLLREVGADKLVCLRKNRVVWSPRCHRLGAKVHSEGVCHGH